MEVSSSSTLFEVALALVRFDHVASCVVNFNHSITRTAAVLCVSNGIADCVWVAIPYAREWQYIRDQINAAMIFARFDS